MAFPVAPEAISARVGEYDVARAQEREVVRDARADRAGAGYDNSSSHASSSVARRRSAPERGANVFPDGHASPLQHALQRRMARVALDRVQRISRQPWIDGGDPLGKRCCERRDRTDRTFLQPARDERLRPDEDVQAEVEVAREPSYGVSETLSPARFGASSPRRCRTAGGTAYPLARSNS